MKLSILIPTHNDDCRLLVQDLLRQLPADAEIIVGDDCSTDADIVKAINQIASLPQCRLWRPSSNLGRAAIRNALAQAALGEWLLFIDADAEVRSASFLSDYLQATDLAEVICGGTGNLPACPRPQARLRYLYEVDVEKRLSLPYRAANPYGQFTTFNFMIRRSLFNRIRFDESCREYGHEDTFFGLQLKQLGIPILHIDNKLTHLGLEDAAVYLGKTETALRTLSHLPLEMQQHARVSAMALKLGRLHLLPIVSVAFVLLMPLLRHNLLGTRPLLPCFALYKLGYYIRTACLRQSGK